MGHESCRFSKGSDHSLVGVFFVCLLAIGFSTTAIRNDTRSVVREECGRYVAPPDTVAMWKSERSTPADAGEE